MNMASRHFVFKIKGQDSVLSIFLKGKRLIISYVKLVEP